MGYYRKPLSWDPGNCSARYHRQAGQLRKAIKEGTVDVRMLRVAKKLEEAAGEARRISDG